jgi:hypothetical protein
VKEIRKRNPGSFMSSYDLGSEVGTPGTKCILLSLYVIQERGNRPATFISCIIIKKGKAILVTGLRGPEGCETSRLPHFLDNRLTDGGKIVRLTPRPPFTPQEDSWYSFLLGT